MKRLLLVIILIVGCRSGSVDDKERWRESLSELDYCAKWCDVGARHYEAIANRAEQEGYMGAGRLFHALSYIEQIYKRLYIEALMGFGGHYSQTTYPHIAIDSTPINIVHASQLWLPRDHMLPERIATIIHEGNRYVARLMIRHGAAANRRLREVERYRCGKDAETPHFLVCPRCGYMCDDNIVDSYCPQCYMPQSTFRIF
ncbi:MAG: hypothetical protein UHY58_07885 [Alistipes sp.]|nr:hypothetical protein [Alistipes sp.]